MHVLSSTFYRPLHKKISIFLDIFLYFDSLVCVHTHSMHTVDTNCISHRNENIDSTFEPKTS